MKFRVGAWVNKSVRGNSSSNLAGMAFLACMFITPLMSVASAQQVEDRAGSLKSWREQCNDPDVDLRQAYVQTAIESDDVAVQRICIRLALESDNSDIRNLGLRAAIASTPRIFFNVEIPLELAEAIKAAGSNEKKLAEISKWYVTRDYEKLKNGLSFEIDGASVTSGSSNWHPLVGLTERSEKSKGVAVVTGSRINWHGRAYLSQDDCSLDLQVAAGTELKGTFQCANLPRFPVSAKLL